MTEASSKPSGSGFFSKLLVLALLALAIWLYLRIVLIDGDRTYVQAPAQASVRVVEADSPPLRALPEEQMALVRRVFAPELAH